MAVVLVPDIQGPDDYGVQNCDDNKGEEDDTEHEDAIQDEAEALVRGVRAAHVDVIRADLYRGGQTRLVQTHHQRQGDKWRHNLPRGVHVTERLSFERVTHADVSLKGEADDNPGGEESRYVLQVNQDLADAILF